MFDYIQQDDIIKVDQNGINESRQNYYLVERIQRGAYGGLINLLHLTLISQAGYSNAVLAYTTEEATITYPDTSSRSIADAKRIKGDVITELKLGLIENKN